MIMEIPKYILVYRPQAPPLNKYVIYEQAEVDGKVQHKMHMMYPDMDLALDDLGRLNDDKPIILAYSSKLMDNTFKV